MCKQNHIDQLLESIHIVGGLLTSQILREARKYNLPGQSPEDYGVPKGLKMADELGRYWRIAQSYWQSYKEQSQRTDIHPERVAMRPWLLPLLQDVLGYRIERAEPRRIGEREFPITHQTHNGLVPLVLCDASKPLDKGDTDFGQDGNKRSPMGLAQEYLNAETDCLWALVSNGTSLRLLRDNPAMTRPAYIEVDFAQMFDENNYADFATLWLLLHSSRTEPKSDAPEQCWLEKWRHKGASEGERVLGQLRYGVADALRALGTGFVAHPDNQTLREQVNTGELTTEAYYQQVLRLVYRLLFLLTAEDRDLALLPADFQGEDYRTARELYQQAYSVANLRQRSRLRALHDYHGDAWQQLMITFAGFANGQPLLAQPALGGLFAADQCPVLETCALENHYLYEALFKLGFFQHNGVLSPINYRDMQTEEFGSVYESLLELAPQLHTEGQWDFSFLGDAKNEQIGNGHARKLSGAYYTPDSLVQELIESALEPVIEDRLQRNPHNPRSALLTLSVCDPACGSGHFLLAAARRLATELARIDAAPDQPTEHHYHHALRDVMQHCIYGVDINPLAIELCKTGLWLESIEPGKPLGFLDAHIQCGNALVGVLNPALLENGIPGDAYKALTGDDKKTCTELRKINQSAAKNLALAQQMSSLFSNQLESMPEDSVQQVEAKRCAYQQARQNQQTADHRLKEDLFTAAFFAPKTSETRDSIPTNAHLKLLADGGVLPEPVRQTVTELAQTHRFFHWPQAFPAVFGEAGGFDVMLGNPPWERIKLQEKEFFDTRSAEIAHAANAAARNQKIAALAASENPAERALYREFMQAKQGTEGASAFARLSGRYPLTGRGDVNLYAIFAEHFARAVNPDGRAGVIVPTGIATDDSTKLFFGWLAESHRLASLYDFENREKLFAAVDSRMKFCLLTLGQNVPQANLAFFATQPQQLKDERRRFSLSSEDFALINPNTKTCPVFRSQMDAELTKKFYRRVPVLIDKTQGGTGNPWNVGLRTMFHKTNASKCGDLKPTGEVSIEAKSEVCWLTVYEGDYGHQYDHRYATFDDGKIRLVTDKEHRDSAFKPNFELRARQDAYEKFLSRWETQVSQPSLLGFRRVASSTNERTSIATILPMGPATYGWILILNPPSEQQALLCANFNSLVFDYLLRNSLSQPSIPQGIYEQLPVLEPDAYTQPDRDYIVPRVLELNYTAHDLKPFAEDLGYHGEPFPFNPERRHQLKSELDAYYAKLYGLTRDELRYILDPTDVMGEDYPSETFRVLKNKEIKEFGEYRTQRLVLEAFDAFAEVERRDRRRVVNG